MRRGISAFENDLIAKAFDSPGEVALSVVWIELVEEVAAEILVRLFIAEHVVNDDQQLVGGSHDGLTNSLSSSSPVENSG